VSAVAAPICCVKQDLAPFIVKIYLFGMYLQLSGIYFFIVFMFIINIDCCCVLMCIKCKSINEDLSLGHYDVPTGNYFYIIKATNAI